MSSILLLLVSFEKIIWGTLSLDFFGRFSVSDLNGFEITEKN